MSHRLLFFVCIALSAISLQAMEEQSNSNSDAAWRKQEIEIQKPAKKKKKIRVKKVKKKKSKASTYSIAESYLAREAEWIGAGPENPQEQELRNDQGEELILSNLVWLLVYGNKTDK